MPTEPLIVTRTDGAVAIISTNDDPLNRMTLAYVEQLEETLDAVADDDTIRALVLTAEGTTNFSVGMNLKELGPGMEAAGGPDAFFDRRLELVARLETLGKPSVATLFGYCLGAGLEVPLGCTFRLAAAEDAQIGLPELELGTTPAWGGTARLARCVGRDHALDLILRSKKISGPEAFRIGLVHEVWPLAELKERAVGLATALAAQPATAVRTILEALHNSEDKSLEELLGAERAAVHATMRSPDAVEGVTAFLEKRRPVFNQVTEGSSRRRGGPPTQ